MLLSGVRVIEHATYIAAPGAGGVLADWGANVIKIEPPGGDPIRQFFASIGADIAVNPVFELDNRGKRSIVIDASLPDGQDLIRKLADSADVFLTNVRPGGLKRAGLDAAALQARNPRLIYASVSGYGLEGPDADRPGFDIAAFWSRSGMATATLPKGAEPIPIRTGVGDHICSMATLSGILAALYEREKTGRGRIVEASLMRAANYALGSDMAIQLAFGRLASTKGRVDTPNPLANFFKSRDGRWICLVPRQSNEDWHAIRRALDLDDDPRFARAKERRANAAALVATLDAAFAAHDFAALTQRLDAQSLAWAPVQTPAEAAADPQLRAAGGVVRTPRPDGSSIEAPGGPLRFPGLDDGPKGPAPAPGGDALSVLRDAGLDEAEIAKLIDAAVVQPSA